ncbi:MAG TPA: RluA family pseudouridine synthase [Opitutaceae bacterium]|nr:RluA family pseudouridine synthase [Opitutaceae bacterium]
MMMGNDEPLPPPQAPLVDPAEVKAWVLHEDARLLVIDKPGWLVVHPSKNGPWSSLAGAVRESFAMDKVRMVYRLDRETSGVIIFAKDEATGSRLQRATARGLLGKAYTAVLEGELAGPVAIDRPLGPDPTSTVTVRQRVEPAGTPGTQPAHTMFEPLARAGGFTIAGVRLLTGRKHQIRAHAEALGHRVAGDKLYGPDESLYLEFAEKGWTARHSALLPLTRQALHCAAMDLRAARMEHVFRAPWPADLARFTERRMGLAPAEVQRLVDGFVERALASGGADLP